MRGVLALRAGRPCRYRDRLAQAWTHADPEPRRRLAALDLAPTRTPPED